MMAFRRTYYTPKQLMEKTQKELANILWIQYSVPNLEDKNRDWLIVAILRKQR